MKKLFKLIFAVAFAFVVLGMTDVQDVQAANTTTTTDEGLVLEYDESRDGTNAYITGYVGINETIIVPEYYGTHPIVEIEKEAFRNNKTIKSITIPQTVGYVGDHAFENCSNLEEFKVEGNFIEWCEVHKPFSYVHSLYLCEHCFEGCTALKSINLECVWEVGPGDESPFFGSGIETATVTIRSSTYEYFIGCANLETINLYFGAKRYNASLDLNSWKSLPSLKTINIYNPRNMSTINAVYLKDADGNYKNIDNVPYLPTLETINIYYGGESVKETGRLPRYAKWVSSNEKVAKLTDDGFGYCTIYSEGIATFTSSEVDYKVNVMVGDESSWEKYRLAAEKNANNNNNNDDSSSSDKKDNTEEDEEEQPAVTKKVKLDAVEKPVCLFAGTKVIAGEAEPGSTVKCTYNGKTYLAETNDNGLFIIETKAALKKKKSVKIWQTLNGETSKKKTYKVTK